MPQTITIRIPFKDVQNDILVQKYIAQHLGVKKDRINAYQIIRRSMDARSKNIIAQLQINVFIEEDLYDEFEFNPNLQNVSNSKEIYIF